MRNTNGITLIALVITIIVLLILAGVSVATLTRENGIFTKSNIAKKQTEMEEAKEQAKLDIATYIADNLEKGENNTLDNNKIQKILTGKSYVREAKDTCFTTLKSGYEILYSDLYDISSGNTSVPDPEPKPRPKAEVGKIVTDENSEYTKNGTAIIPVGFAIVPGLDNIAEGLVISDVANDTNNTGNQFVWIPVPKIEDFHKIKNYRDNKLQNTAAACSDPFKDGTDTEITDYEAMKKSVEENYGFYIGRYETGKDNDENVVVKKNMPVYTNIPWGTSMTDMTGGAVEKAKNFTNGKIYNKKVTSTLVYGIQWDAALQFIDSNYIKEDINECNENSYVRNSANKGWYSNNYNKNPEHRTGIDVDSNTSNCVKNIYDMAGNVTEWTMEVIRYSFSNLSRWSLYL